MQSNEAHAARVLLYLSELRPGSVISGKYRLEHELGTGGMGAVYAARHVQLGAKLAIKVLLSKLLEDPDAIARFGREARAAATITNDHVVRILDVGQLASGAPYMVMEFLEGQDGAAYLKQHQPLQIDLVIDFVLQACSAVMAAHALGIIHRDLKPANLFFVPRPDGRPMVKVLDFGVSKIVAESGHEAGRLTTTGVTVGSPAYAPPEQLRVPKDTDKRADIWALGVILYELLTGTMPFEGSNAALIAVNIAAQKPPPLRRLRSDIPADLEHVVLRCLEKNPDDRFQEVADLVEALRACQHGHSAIEKPRRDLRVQLASITRRWRGATHIRRIGGVVTVALVALAWIGALLHGRDGAVPQAHDNSAFDKNPVRFEPGASAVTLAPLASASSESPPSPPSEPRMTPLPSAQPKATPAGHHRSAQPADSRSQPPNGGLRVDAGVNVGASRCDPPYYFDERGNRLFKVDCL
jgi:serine/threonine-protein kinase